MQLQYVFTKYGQKHRQVYEQKEGQNNPVSGLDLGRKLTAYAAFALQEEEKICPIVMKPLAAN